MTTTLTLSSVTQADVDQARETLISLIQGAPAYANLDLRQGTALNDLLLLPQSELWALESLRINFVNQVKSLQSMLDSGADIPTEIINNILSNFNLQIKTPSKASGSIIIKLTSDSDYVVATGSRFNSADDLEYVTEQEYKYSRSPVADELPIYSDEDNVYHFIVPVVANDYGDEYLLKEGAEITPATAIYGFVSATAYSDFSGAETEDDLRDVITQLPAAVSHKSLESKKSIEAILTSPDFGNFTDINAISVVGAGDPCQLRDKHNYIGASVFGRVDIYPRTFERPYIVTLLKTGIRVAPRTYEITLDADDAPGYYSVRSVSESESTITPLFSFDTLTVVGSYAFDDTRSSVSVFNTYHDISSTNSVIETAYTKYQQGKLTVYDVYTTADDEHPFKVELYAAPSIADIQDYIDDEAIKNVKADYIIRSPLICLVSLRATVDIPSANFETVQGMLVNNIVATINKASFTSNLTQSEIVGALIASGVKSINLTKDPVHGFRMEGRIRAADGSIIQLPGPDLSINNVSNEKLLVAANTCVFATEPTNIFITMRSV